MEDFEIGSKRLEIGIFPEIGIGEVQFLFGKVKTKKKKFVWEVLKNCMS
jgi:hypothetical protein